MGSNAQKREGLLLQWMVEEGDGGIGGRRKTGGKRRKDDKMKRGEGKKT